MKLNVTVLCEDTVVTIEVPDEVGEKILASEDNEYAGDFDEQVLAEVRKTGLDIAVGVDHIEKCEE